MNLADLVICANASSNGRHQARRSTTYTLQLEKIHCRMNHLTHQSFPYSQSHSKFVLAYSFYRRQNIGTDIRGHFRRYPYPRRAPPVTTAWFVPKLLIKQTAPDVECRQSRWADMEFWVEQYKKKAEVLACVTPCSLIDKDLDNTSFLKMESPGQSTSQYPTFTK
jgi:hypothetical protein